MNAQILPRNKLTAFTLFLSLIFAAPVNKSATGLKNVWLLLAGRGVLQEPSTKSNLEIYSIQGNISCCGPDYERLVGKSLMSVK